MCFRGYLLRILNKSVTTSNPGGIREKTQKSREPPGESGRVGNYAPMLTKSQLWLQV